MFIHGYLLMEGHKMSKSLGNVLDPFEVIERFGADALRFYCFREVSFGQDGSVSAAGFEARYETELANDYGNLASRTLAMIERYRDGVVPEAEPDPELAGGDDGLAGPRGQVRELLDRGRADPGAGGDLVARAAAQPLRRGDPALGSRQGRGPGGPPGCRCSTGWPRGFGSWRCSCSPTCPRPAGGCSTRSREGGRELDAFGSRGGGQTIEKLAPLFPKIEAAAAVQHSGAVPTRS